MMASVRNPQCDAGKRRSISHVEAAMIVMHGIFDLKDGVDAADFRSSYDKFARHLQSLGLAETWRFMHRRAQAGYDARPPAATFYIALEFPDMAQAEECWTRAEQGEEPLRSLHRAVNTKVRNTSFFLCSDVPISASADSEPDCG